MTAHPKELTVGGDLEPSKALEYARSRTDGDAPCDERRTHKLVELVETAPAG